MKFLCDNCKAKYQIGDDKVAGKTVRMKCRKCGHQIEVRAAVTETSVARPPPRAPSGPPSKPPPPRSSLATSLSAAKPRVPTTSTAPSSALAGAFKSNLQDAPASTNEPQAASLGDEWYVAINGVPVGPVRLSELRRKAASGAVTEESLCWQEGLEEWRPIRSIPELAALVREAAQVGRPSIISTPEPMPVPPAPRPSLAPRPPSPSIAPVAPLTPRSTAPLAPATGRSNVVPLRPAASSPPEDVTVAKVMGPGPAAAAALAPPAPLTPPAPAALAPPETAADPFAVPLPAPAAVPAPIVAASPVMEPPAPRTSGGSKIPLWFWLVLLPAMGFGITVAVMVFKPQPAQAPVVIQMPATAAPTESATPKAAETAVTPTPEPTASAATTDTKSKPGPVAAKGPAAPAKAADVPEKKGIDLGGLVPNGGGPNVGPNSAPGAGGGGLDSAGVERVVASHKNGVKRTCWERGGSGQASSVNIIVTANVAPNGTVASTSSTGDDPVVAKCIEGQVRTWQFPAPGSTTTLQIPFKFVRQ